MGATYLPARPAGKAQQAASILFGDDLFTATRTAVEIRQMPYFSHPPASIERRSTRSPPARKHARPYILNLWDSAMVKKVSVIIGTMATAAILSVASFTQANAFPFAVALDSGAPPQVTLVAEGCGYGWWRGPWGHCRHTAYFGNLPGGGYSAQPDCPAGYWVGPWGHCRDTPYHGRLPGGDYR